MSSKNMLAELDLVMQARKAAAPDTSYVASLLHKGEDAILKKVAEEAAEVIMASKDLAQKSHDSLHLVKEVADLWFHTSVLLAYHGLSSEDVMAELARREHTSGLVEKAARPKA